MKNHTIRDNQEKKKEYSDQYHFLNDIRYRVTRAFCILCCCLTIPAVLASFFALNRNLYIIINSIYLLSYSIPLILIFRTKTYHLSARIFVGAAVSTTLCNALAADFDISVSTVVWYFVFLVFAHLVLGLRWAAGVAVFGFVSVTVFAGIHLVRDDFGTTKDLATLLIISTPVTLLVAFIALLYLLTVYKRLRDITVSRIIESEREKSQLVGIMSHDMRNYLGAIQGIGMIISEQVKPCADRDLTNEITELVALINQTTSGGLLMVEDTVAALHQTEDRDVFFEKLEITHFIAPIFQRYQVLARYKKILFVMDEQYDQAMVTVHKETFSRAIENLLSNAIKFSKTGDTITIATKRLGDEIEISVSDTGIGIPPELREKIFEPFTEAGRIGTANEKSIGLGMSIVKKIVEEHHGRIRFESTVGKGTTFIITLAVVH